MPMVRSTTVTPISAENYQRNIIVVGRFYDEIQ